MKVLLAGCGGGGRGKGGTFLIPSFSHYTTLADSVLTLLFWQPSEPWSQWIPSHSTFCVLWNLLIGCFPDMIISVCPAIHFVDLASTAWVHGTRVSGRVQSPLTAALLQEQAPGRLQAFPRINMTSFYFHIAVFLSAVMNFPSAAVSVVPFMTCCMFL